jgi:hypothetical protein
MGTPFLWARGGGFAARVRDLNPRHRSVLLDKAIDAGHRLDVSFRPDAGVTKRNCHSGQSSESRKLALERDNT